MSAVRCSHCAHQLNPESFVRVSTRYCRQAAFIDRRLGKAHQRIVRERNAKLALADPAVADAPAVADIKTANRSPSASWLPGE